MKKIKYKKKTLRKKLRNVQTISLTILCLLDCLPICKLLSPSTSEIARFSTLFLSALPVYRLFAPSMSIVPVLSLFPSAVSALPEGSWSTLLLSVMLVLNLPALSTFAMPMLVLSLSFSILLFLQIFIPISKKQRLGY